MIKIVADSLGDLPADVVARHDITIVPSYVTFGAETRRDRVDIQPAEFFKKLAESSDLPTTSQASVQDYDTAFKGILARAPGAVILAINCSSALSGSIESAKQASRQSADASIFVFDTRSISMGEGLMTVEAAQLAERDTPLDEMLIRLEAMRAGMHSYFTLNTLDYLAKGGRIGRAARLLGTLLDMKPLLKLENGAIAPDDRHHSRARAIAALADKIIDAMRGKRRIRLGVAHAACEAEAQELSARLQDAVKPEIFVLGEVGPAIGAYTGPGGLGAFAWAED